MEVTLEQLQQQMKNIRDEIQQIIIDIEAWNKLNTQEVPIGIYILDSSR